MIETERLILRAFEKSDARYVFEYANAQTVHCYIDTHYDSVEEAERLICERPFNGEYAFTVVLRESGKVIGEIFSEPEAMAHDEEDPGTFSPCWMLHPDYHGRGYGYEMAQAYFDYLFGEKGARRIYACTEIDNYPSQSLCRKLGMRHEGTFLEYISFVNNPDGTPLYEDTIQFAILKKEWCKLKEAES